MLQPRCSEFDAGGNLEAGERHGKVRFGNIAGNDLNCCDGRVRADFIETSEEFRESIMRSKSTGKSFKVGSEVQLNGQVSATGEVPTKKF